MRKFALSPVLLSLIPTISFAATIERLNSNFDIVFVEGNQLSLALDAKASSIDNFLFQQEEQESTGAISIKPSVFVQAHNENHLIQVHGELNRRQFDKFDEDDHTEKTLLAKYFFKLAQDHRTFVSFSFDDEHEFRGQGLTKGSALSVDKGDTLENTLINFGYQYGRVDSVSRINVVAGKHELEYSTRKALTADYNYERDFVLADLDYLIGAKTYLSISLEYSDYQYESSPSRDKEVSFALAGIKWRPSAASELGLLLGAEELSFDSGSSDESQFKWRINYNWRPVDYLRINVSSGRTTDTTAELASDYKIRDSYTVAANYKINEFFTYKVSAVLLLDEVSFEEQNRDEDTLSVSTGLDFKYSESISFYADIDYSEVNSDVDVFEYDRLMLSVGTKLSF